MASSADSSTDSLLNSFPMFGHPGISALEYAGQMEAKRKMSNSLSDASLKRKSTTSTNEESHTTPPTTAGTDPEAAESVCRQLHFIDEFGCQQRRRGTFLNHTPRNFELRAGKAVEVTRPVRPESENYSRPLSRIWSAASGSPVLANQHGGSPSTRTESFKKHSIVSGGVLAESEAEDESAMLAPDHEQATTVHRRTVSIPLSRMVADQADASGSKDQPGKDLGLRSASATGHQPLETKRRRRQTPYKLNTSRQNHLPRHSPLEPLVAEHRRMSTVEAIGDVPFDMDREVSAEIGTFGVIQRYFDSQGGGLSPRLDRDSQSSSHPSDPYRPSTSGAQQPFREPVAIYPIDELDLPDAPPPVPDRSPKRLTHPNFTFPNENATLARGDLDALDPQEATLRNSDSKFAAEGECSPYVRKSDMLRVSKKRAQERLPVVEAAWIGSPQVGKLAPPILGHDALTTSGNLGLNDLSYYLRYTGPSLEPQQLQQKRRKKTMRLFKVKQRKSVAARVAPSLAARVGSVEGSPERARTPPVPACARQMITSAGAKHLKIIIPPESSTTNQFSPLPTQNQQQPQRCSRQMSLSFTEEMFSPLAGTQVERLISGFTTPPERRSMSDPPSRSSRSLKRSPKALKPEPVDQHPLASRDEQTRARKLRDLQRIKRKPVSEHSPSERQKPTDMAALPTPAHTPEPASANTHEDEGIAEESPADKMSRLQDCIVSLQRQNAQLAAALAKIVGLEIEDGDLEGEDVLRAFRQLQGSGV